MRYTSSDSLGTIATRMLPSLGQDNQPKKKYTGSYTKYVVCDIFGNPNIYFSRFLLGAITRGAGTWDPKVLDLIKTILIHLNTSSDCCFQPPLLEHICKYMQILGQGPSSHDQL